MVYEVIALSGVVVLASGVTIARSIYGVKKTHERLLIPVERSFKRNLASLDWWIEHYRELNLSEDEIMHNVRIGPIDDSTIGLNTDEQPLLGDVYSDISEAYAKWSGFSRREKVKRAMQRPYMPMPGAEIQITA